MVMGLLLVIGWTILIWRVHVVLQENREARAVKAELAQTTRDANKSHDIGMDLEYGLNIIKKSQPVPDSGVAINAASVRIISAIIDEREAARKRTTGM